MSRHPRYLRITWTVFCGVACLLLIALWVRSFWWTDSLDGPVLWPNGCSVTSTNGRLMINDGDREESVTEWDFLSFKFDDPVRGVDPQFLGPVFAFHPSEADETYLCVPHWFLALIAGSIAFIFARGRSYSLRTMMLVVTLIAIGLGLIAYYATHAEQGGGGGGSGNGGLASRLGR
jgi:hypothetical protein